MSGFLGTLFTGRVALNLALPSQAQFGRATSLFGRGIEGIIRTGTQATAKMVDDKQKLYSEGIANIKRINAEAVMGDKDALRKEMKAANKVIADELKWGEGQLKKWASFGDWSKSMAGKGLDAFGMGELLSEYAGDDFTQAIDEAQHYENVVNRFTHSIDNFAKESVQRFRSGLYEMTLALVGFYYSLNQVTNTFRQFEEQLINAQSLSPFLRYTPKVYTVLSVNVNVCLKPCLLSVASPIIPSAVVLPSGATIALALAEPFNVVQVVVKSSLCNISLVSSCSINTPSV